MSNMNSYEEQYLRLLSNIKMNGVLSKNRTGINTYKIWGAQLHINLQEGFPLLTTKKMHWKSVVHELLWMIAGDTNIQYLLKNGVTFWSEWPYQKYLNECGSEECNDQKSFEKRIIEDDTFAKKWGSIGEYGYGGLWRKFPYFVDNNPNESQFKNVALGRIDQLQGIINELKTNPDSRRIIMSVWHPYHSNRKEDALLPACHNYIQFGTEELTFEERWAYAIKIGKHSGVSWETEKYVTEHLNEMNIPKYRLNCYYSMRSNDFFLGNPYNNSFYALLTHLIANHLNMIPNQLVFSGADVHLYENHLEQCKLQLTREPRSLPKLNIKTPGKSLFDITYDDIELLGYDPHPAIKAEVAV